MNYDIAYFQAPGDISFKPGSLKTIPEKDFLRLEVLYCGLCGTDLLYYSGARKQSYPKSIGHEMVCRVIDSNCSDTQIKTGDLVVTDLSYRCDDCDYCKSDKEHFCVQEDAGLFSNRGFSKYIDIHHNYLFKISLDRDIFAGALFEPLACMFHALKRVNILKHKNIHIIGAGGMGSMMAIMISWLYPEINFSIHDSNYEKALSVAKIIGSRCKVIKDEVNKYDLVFEISGSIDGLSHAIDIIDKQGTICIVSVYKEGDTVYDMLHKIYSKELKIVYSYHSGNRSELHDTIELIEQNWRHEYNDLLSIHDISQLEAIFDYKVNDRVSNRFLNKVIFKVL